MDDLGEPWEERAVTVKELNHASKALFSNGTVDVVPVVQFNHEPYMTGRITQVLQHEY